MTQMKYRFVAAVLVLASSTAVRAAGPFEGSLWRSAGSAELRGRPHATELFQPV